MNRLFGTDGIRGKFGYWPLTKPVIYSVSLAVGQWLKKKFKQRKVIRVVIGKDTRASCDTIEKILTFGLEQQKIQVLSSGVIPTPGLAFLTKNSNFDLGIMISASHNLAQDNGIKFFKHDGYKLSVREEKELEKIILSCLKKKKAANKNIYTNRQLKMISTKSYLDHLKKCALNLNLSKKTIVIDCADGAVSYYAEKLLRFLGAQVFAVHDNPDGKNINLGCGSLHPKHVADYTRKKKADIGFSFDGDGDRVIVSDEKGRILDGDYMMALVAKYFLQKHKLSSSKVVTTSMSNFGLEKFLSKLNIKLIRTDVGDRFVLEQMKKERANFGGEQSGHIIFHDYATTGDGMLTALQILNILTEEKKSILELLPGFKKYPQVLYNVKVKQKKGFAKMPAVWARIKRVEKELGGNGRLVIRYSGTEPLARIMIEAVDKQKVKRYAQSIASAISKEIGVQ